MELARRLLASGTVSSHDLGRALLAAVQGGAPLVLALAQSKALGEADLESELAHGGGPTLQRVQPSVELCARLPARAARRLGVVPLRRDPLTGIVDAAALDPLDAHASRELSFLLGEPVRLLRARAADLEEAWRSVDGDARPRESKRLRCHTPASPHGAPLSWRPAQEELPVESPIPLVRRSAPPAAAEGSRPMRLPAFTEREVEHDSDGELVVPLRSLRAPAAEPTPSPDATVATSGAVESERRRPSIRPSIVVDIPPPRTRPAGTEMPSAVPGPPTSPAARTLVPPGPLAAPAPTGEGAPRLPDPLAHGERTSTLDAEALAAGGLVRAAAPAPALAAADDDFADVVALVRRAPSRDAVVDRVHRGLARIARRTAVLAVRRDGYVGWACNEAFGDLAAFRAVVVPPEAPSVFRTAGTTAVYLGPVPETPAHEGVLRVMGHASGDVAAVSVRVAGRPAMVLLADDLDDLLVGTRRMDELARAAGEALGRLLGAR